MIILAVDTATAATSVALRGPSVAVSRRSVDPHGHVEALAPMIADVLAESGIEPRDIDALACGVGPGPFTGLRVAIAQVIAMGAALSRPVVGVCTHDVIAHAVLGLGDRAPNGQGARTEPRLRVATTARRAETFISTYDSAGWRIDGPIALRNDEAREALASGDLIIAGDAVDRLVEQVPTHRRGPDYPDALDLAAIVESRRTIGEDWPEVELSVELDPATSRGDSTARLLGARARQGRVLLPPRPLYLRAPDAVAPAALTTTDPEPSP